MKFDRIIRSANLKTEDVILDFGCGDGWLKKSLPQYNIIGYDINPKQTEVKDYKKIRPTKIFAIDVFEHIPEKTLMEILKNFKRMGNFELIVCIPTENLFSRKSRKILGKRERPADHVTNYKKIRKILDKNFELIKKINFIAISYFLKYRNKED